MRIVTPIITLAALAFLGGCADTPAQTTVPASAGPVAQARHDWRVDGSRNTAGPMTAFFGVAVSPADDTLREQLGLPENTGLVVDYVAPNSPAAKAGVKVHDVVKNFNGNAVTSPEQFVKLVQALNAEDAITLSVLHAGKPVQIKATLAAVAQPAGPAGRFGIMRGFGGWNAQGGMGPMSQWQQGGGPMGGSQRGMGPNNQWQGGGGPVGQGPRDDAGPMGQGQRGGPMNQWQRNGGQPMAPAPRDGAPTTGPAQRNGPPMGWNQRGDTGRVKVNQNQSSVKVLMSSDQDGTLRFTDIDGQKHLTARDKDGKVIFDGPVDTEDQRKALPPELAAKLKKMDPIATP